MTILPSISVVVLLGLIFAMERAALDRWGKGDPWGFTEISADEVTYYDAGTERRVDGLGALINYTEN